MADDILSALFSNGGWRDLLGLPTQPPQNAGSGMQLNAMPIGGGPFAGTPPPPPETQGFQGGMIPLPADQPTPNGGGGPVPAPTPSPPGPMLTPEDAMSLSANPSGATMPSGGTPGSALAALPPGGGMGPQGTGGNMAFAGPPPPVNTSTGLTMPGAPQPLPPPPPNPGGANYGDTAGSLANAFGIGAKPTWNQRLSDGLAGLGKGLSQVGAMRPGAPAAQAFAAGAGGGLTGTYEAQEHRKKLLFDQSSTAFRDMMLAQSTGDMSAYRQAQVRRTDALAQQAMLGGAGGKNSAYQNDPFWKGMKVQAAVQAFENSQRQIMLEQWRRNNTPEDQQEEDKKKLKEKVDAFRADRQKALGIDPKDMQKQLTMGLTKDNPFDTKGMPLDQFMAKVPLSYTENGQRVGGWYKDQNGNLQQRKLTDDEIRQKMNMPQRQLAPEEQRRADEQDDRLADSEEAENQKQASQ
jgi:hypothetical protein